jgi:hypothetical protein
LNKATASRVADRYQSVEEFWEGFAQVRLAGAASQLVDDEATIVRSRLSATSAVEQVAARPNFQTLANVTREIARPQKARIVVELPSHADRRGSVGEQSYGGAVEEQRSEGAEGQRSRGAEERASVATQAFGSPSAANGSRVQTLDRNGNVAVTTEERNAAALSGRKTSVRVYRAERGVLDRMRAVISSEWLRRVFIIFLAAALIGLAASTYYHFADQRTGLPFFGSPAKDGRIAGALNVNLRSEPFGSVLLALPEKTRVRVVEERNGWLRIKILEWAGGAPDNAPEIGWVDGRFVKMD